MLKIGKTPTFVSNGNNFTMSLAMMLHSFAPIRISLKIAYSTIIPISSFLSLELKGTVFWKKGCPGIRF